VEAYGPSALVDAGIEDALQRLERLRGQARLHPLKAMPRKSYKP
jgi:hypothetical protein